MIQNIIGDIIVIIGLVFMMFGVIGIYKFDNFYTRLLASSKSDIVGALTMIIGISVRHGFTYFTGKLALIAVIMLIFNPLIAHVLARSAYLSEHQEKDSL